jgi:ABC-2 type transport system permease protein
VRSVLRLASSRLKTELRERITLFWFIVFPLFLLTLLTLIFGNMGQTGEITFSAALVNFDPLPAASGGFGEIIQSALLDLSQPTPGKPKPLFELHLPPQSVDLSGYLAQELEALRIGQLAAVIEIPQDLSSSILARASGSTAPAAPITIYTSGGRTSSGMALSVIEQVLAGIDQEILTRLGLFDGSKAIAVDHVEVGMANKTYSYIDYLLPGIVLMGFFTAGLFTVPAAVLFGRERRILKQYWVTPLNVPRYLAGFGLGHLALCAIQLLFVWGLGRLAFGATVNLFSPLPLALLLFAAATFLALGFFIAAVSPTANAGMAIANIANMPLMFLGGLFFPIGSLPSVLRWIMMVNPVTYLADAVRAAAGVDVAQFPLVLSLGVPAAWIAICGALAGLRLKWGTEK